MPTPATEHQLCQYVLNLALDNLRHPTIKNYLSLLHTLLNAWAGFFGFLRAGELTVPYGQAYDEGAHLKLLIKASKTDPFWVGVDVFIRHAYAQFQ
jgi:hypothetical protein